jgi:uncharacterized protein
LLALLSCSNQVALGLGAARNRGVVAPVRSPAMIPPVDESEIRAFCERWDVQREDFNTESDIDLLVTFAEHRRPTLFLLVEMAEELGELYGRRVDLMLRRSVERSDNWIRREQILSNARPLYLKK